MSTILSDLGPACRDTVRRSLIMSNPGLGLNGIDFVEYRENAGAPRHVLEVHFLLALPANAFGLPGSLADIHVEGGTRIVNIQPVAATPDPLRPNVLNIEVDQQGDFSTYVLSLGWRRQPDGSWRFALPGVDRQFSVAPISFRPGCPVDFDCLVPEICPPAPPPEPRLDYLAKDYASFRRLLLDLVAQRYPGWVERSPADLGIALVELLAHEGDHLSYFQDAAANEAFLDTARLRTSAKRHARLVDYTMHDGRNAWAYVHVAVNSDGLRPPGLLLFTRVTTPIRGQLRAPDPVIPPTLALDFDADPALAQARVFETATSLRGRRLSNAIRLHTWGNRRCCLPRGTTTVHLYTFDDVTQAAQRPDVVPGDYLLLEEVRGPETGAAADADPAHRQVVRVVRVRDDATMIDPVYSDTLNNGVLQPRGAGNPLPLLEVTWRPADALTFPLCLSITLADGTVVEDVSLARGNVVLADHGRTLSEEFAIETPLAADHPVRLRLGHGPLTMHCLAGVRPEDVQYHPLTGRVISERPDLGCDVRAVAPAVWLEVTTTANVVERWTAVPDLLSSGEFDRHFVVDVEDEGRATLRFGDGEYGRRLTEATRIVAWYRVGNGHAGNVGPEALAHIVLPPPTPAGTVASLRNPLPAWAGTDAESIEEVRQYAPAAFRARQFRAVTTDDYRDAALTLAGVAGAVAGFRWTGSWHTVFVGIDPASPDDLITEPGGRTRLAPAFEAAVRAGLERFRLAGYDLEIRAARYVPLRIELELCVLPGYFRGDVAHAVAEALGSRLTRGRRPGFFHPDRFTFGQPVYLSRLYADVEAVAGVDSVAVTVFQRFGQDPAGELEAGVLQVGLWEIPRLDNDPNRMENGVLVITAAGGK